MDELVKLVVDKVGISEAQAKQAVEVVVGFLKDSLPEPIALSGTALIRRAGACPAAFISVAWRQTDIG